mmetsp:Transcript_18370/g.54583  ORF Transcript_18370/g.54583 Transcript_18370/m.54583 type:complete len:182 (-) Transcript_18370:35-580(-)
MRVFTTQILLAAAVRGAQPPADVDTCSGPVQSNLLYGMSHRKTAEGVLAPVDANESLAEAICCDSRASLVAEPQFLYQAPDVQLFARISPDNVTTFYDSVCGLPLFAAPRNRSLADFEADTDEHGWPSFRTAELVAENVVTNGTQVTSVCGTHLGTYDPDAAGPRWCIDLSCIAGRPAQGP